MLIDSLNQARSKQEVMDTLINLSNSIIENKKLFEKSTDAQRVAMAYLSQIIIAKSFPSSIGEKYKLAFNELQNMEKAILEQSSKTNTEKEVKEEKFIPSSEYETKILAEAYYCEKNASKIADLLFDKNSNLINEQLNMKNKQSFMELIENEQCQFSPDETNKAKEVTIKLLVDFLDNESELDSSKLSIKDTCFENCSDQAINNLIQQDQKIKQNTTLSA